MKFSPQLLCSVGIRQQSRATNLSLRPIRNRQIGSLLEHPTQSAQPKTHQECWYGDSPCCVFYQPGNYFAHRYSLIPLSTCDGEILFVLQRVLRSFGERTPKSTP